MSDFSLASSSQPLIEMRDREREGKRGREREGVKERGREGEREGGVREKIKGEREVQCMGNCTELLT